ncbi:MAG: ATP-binding protein [Oscillospiraceae bacterium]|nr:ATP-binding protein [Oscillospiraceae bacterium]
METEAASIAVLSGKGGTGKTLVSVNLAASAKKAVYIDCDVEEPNGHLFFKPEGSDFEDVTVKVPKIVLSLCSGCRKCADFCKFNAIAFIGKQPMVFEDVCHPCGGCVYVCPEKAIKEEDRIIGEIQIGRSEDVAVYTGALFAGEESGVPIIKKLLEFGGRDECPLRIIDCPPGSNCVVMESIRDADYCVLVAEPTIFGVHNLNMVYELVQLFNKPFGVILNKCIEGDNPSEKFCFDHGIPILARIPFDAKLGRLNSNGTIISRVSREYKELFSSLLQKITEEAQHAAAVNS